MRQPRRRGSAIDVARVDEWLRLFAGYRHPVTRHAVDSWLGQFRPADRDFAARVLDCVDYFGYPQCAAAYRALLAGLPGWATNPKSRAGRWRFAAFSGTAGESGDSMLWKFRVANSLGGKANNELFIHRAEILEAGLTADDSLVLVDDFSGTGDQVCDHWKILQELVTGGPTVYLALVAATQRAMSRIKSETDLFPLAHIVLTEKDNIWSARCSHFTASEKAALLSYCVRASNKIPKGRGEAGLLIVFEHSCPNNSIPVLHSRNARWTGLFPRHD